MAKKTPTFLVELETGPVFPLLLSYDMTAKLLSISRPSVYRLRETDPEFAKCCCKVGERPMVSSEKLRYWAIAKCSGGEAS